MTEMSNLGLSNSGLH